MRANTNTVIFREGVEVRKKAVPKERIVRFSAGDRVQFKTGSRSIGTVIRRGDRTDEYIVKWDGCEKHAAVEMMAQDEFLEPLVFGPLDLDKPKRRELKENFKPKVKKEPELRFATHAEMMAHIQEKRAQPAPERYCAACGTKLERKRYGSQLESQSMFERRTKCDRECYIHTKRKLSDEQIEQARRLREGGVSLRDLGKRFNVGHSAIDKALRRTAQPMAMGATA